MLQGIQNVSYIKSGLPKMLPIAPAPERKCLPMDTEKKRYSYTNNPYTGAQAASIARRNARERNRVKQVNDGFNALRKRLPASVIAALSGGSRRGSGKKLSKVDTLRMVVEYIRHLESVLDESDAALGIRKVESQTIGKERAMLYEDEGIFGGNSPYAESVPSPVGSECSSGISSGYSPNSNGYTQYHAMDQTDSMNEIELLDAISWWQQK
ncbi:achaete-scute complex protein T3-like [Achroia grisella]|uniref:achaete-scute complex protein T3-like n=1 Tax=Achroia grisella TaxID=688607 RepID=UPI0027D30E0B|nr:achaete-scute complex protein T3-like [Achroia grisella]